MHTVALPSPDRSSQDKRIRKMCCPIIPYKNKMVQLFKLITVYDK